MKKTQEPRRNPSEPDARPNSNHPLAGTWVQEPNPSGTTSVVYTISVKRGKFLVSAKDEEYRTDLKISSVRWDGESLRFTSVFPPTKHKAKHALKLLSRRRTSYEVSCTYADGHFFSDLEFWKRRFGKKRLSGRNKT